MAVVKTVNQVSNEIRYPINSFDDLVKKTAGMKLSVGKVGINVSDLRVFVPAYYFPIASKENLSEKLNEISKSSLGTLLKSQFGAISIADKVPFPNAHQYIRPNVSVSEVGPLKVTDRSSKAR